MKRIAMLAAMLAAVAGNLSGSPDQSSRDHKETATQQAPADTRSVTVIVDNSQRGEPASSSTPKAPLGNTSQWPLVVVGIITFIIIGWQSWETRKAAEVSKKALHLTQAADIHIQRFFLTHPQDNQALAVPGTLQLDTLVTMIVKNFGRTRAEHFTNDLIMGIQGQLTRPSVPRNEIAVGAIGADQELRIGFGRVGDALTPEGLASVLNGIVPFKVRVL